MERPADRQAFTPMQPTIDLPVFLSNPTFNIDLYWQWIFLPKSTAFPVRFPVAGKRTILIGTLE
jgi:hypothetical protein